MKAACFVRRRKLNSFLSGSFCIQKPNWCWNRLLLLRVNFDIQINLADWRSTMATFAENWCWYPIKKTKMSVSKTFRFGNSFIGHLVQRGALSWELEFEITTNLLQDCWYSIPENVFFQCFSKPKNLKTTWLFSTTVCCAARRAWASFSLKILCFSANFRKIGYFLGCEFP